jgi:hypothetical protein
MCIRVSFCWKIKHVLLLCERHIERHRYMLTYGVVSSHSRLQAKHRPSTRLSKVARHCLVGSRSLVYFEIWMRRPCDSFLNSTSFAIVAPVNGVISCFIPGFVASSCLLGASNTKVLLHCWCVSCIPNVRRGSKRNLKTPVKTRTLHLSEPYDSRSTSGCLW